MFLKNTNKNTIVKRYSKSFSIKDVLFTVDCFPSDCLYKITFKQNSEYFILNVKKIFDKSLFDKCISKSQIKDLQEEVYEKILMQEQFLIYTTGF